MIEIRAILFDLDGTLHDRNATVRHWLTEHLRHFELPDAYRTRFLDLDDFGYRSKREVLPQLVAELGLPHDPATLLAHYGTALKWATPMPYAAEVLTELRRRGVRLGIVTNGWVEAQTECLDHCGLNGLVDEVVISKSVGFSKPDARIYELALERLGVPAEETWFVGDSPKNDVWGPKQVGMRTAYLPTGHPLESTPPDATLTDLRDVLGLPGLPCSAAATLT